MEDHGYNLRQRPFPVTVSTQSSSPISTTLSTVTADSLATVAQSGTSRVRAPTVLTTSSTCPLLTRHRQSTNKMFKLLLSMY